MTQQAGIRRTIAIVLAFILLVVYGFIWRMSQPVIMNNEQLRVNGAVVLDQPRIFSDFELVDHRGEAFNIARMQDIWTIVFLALPTARIFAQPPWRCSMTPSAK